MYGYYAEKDTTLFGPESHRHDWEHIIVWVLNDDLTYVSWSHHGDYTTKYHTAARYDGNHPKFVYHRGGVRTSSMRLAEAKDEKIENHWGIWWRAWLISRESIRDDIAQALLSHDWGSAHPDMRDDRFGAALNGAMPWDAKNNGFNPWS
jgi:hypothetical protein